MTATARASSAGFATILSFLCSCLALLIRAALLVVGYILYLLWGRASPQQPDRITEACGGHCDPAQSHAQLSENSNEPAGNHTLVACLRPLERRSPRTRRQASARALPLATGPPSPPRLMASQQGTSQAEQDTRQRPLKQAIAQCEVRWLHDALQCALDGDPNQMALVSHMYCTGYGCSRNMEEAQRWLDSANKRCGAGLHSDGCALPLRRRSHHNSVPPLLGPLANVPLPHISHRCQTSSLTQSRHQTRAASLTWLT